MGIEAWKRAKKNTNEAVEYLALIGKTTTSTTVAAREGEAATAGKLTKLAISTQINFQPYDGAQNYHDCKAFDEALAAVARLRWSELRDEAMAFLRQREAHEGKIAEAEIEAMLADIRAKNGEVQA